MRFSNGRRKSGHRTWQRYFRTVFAVSVLAACVWFAHRNGGEVQAGIRELGNAWWPAILIAVACQLAYYLLTAGSFAQSFTYLAVPLSLTQSFGTAFASLAVGIIAPGGFAGNILYVKEGVQNGADRRQAVFATLVTLLLSYTAFAFLIAVVSPLLMRYGVFGPYQVAAQFLVSIVGVGVVLALVALTVPKQAARLVVRLLTRFPGLVPAEARHSFAAAIAADLAHYREHFWAVNRGLLYAITAHVFGAGSLLAALAAFHVPLNPLIATAAYGVAQLSWIVSPTPQGVGIVEVAVAAVLIALDVPSPAAVASALTYRLVAFWVPLGIGAIWVQRSTLQYVEVLRSRWSVECMAVLAAGVGALSLLSTIIPPLSGSLALGGPLAVPFLVEPARILVAVAGFLLFVQAPGLWRRERSAYITTLLTLGVGTLGHLGKGYGVTQAAVPVLTFAWLFLHRNQFTVRAAPPSVGRGIQVATVAILTTLGYAATGLLILKRHFQDPVTFFGAAEQAVNLFLPLTERVATPLTAYGAQFRDSVYILGAAVSSFGFLALLRPLARQNRVLALYRRRAAKVISQYAEQPFHLLNLLPDASYWFSEGGSVVRYAISGRICVSLGGPVGPEVDSEAAMHGFVRFCRSRKLLPAVYPVLEGDLPLYRAVGFQFLHVTDAAVVIPETSAASGHETDRAVEGSFTVLKPPHAPAVLETLQAVNATWLAANGYVEPQFLCGWFDSGHLNRNSLTVLTSSRDEILAFAALLQVAPGRPVALDLYRALPVVQEVERAAFVRAMLAWAATQEVPLLSLGVREAEVHPSDSRNPHAKQRQRLSRSIALAQGIQGNRDFFEQFKPTWQPRYLAYLNGVHLPAVTRAFDRLTGGSFSSASIIRHGRHRLRTIRLWHRKRSRTG